MAICLFEAGLNAKNFSIDAIDISSRSLQKAKKGVYGAHSFRGSNQRIKNEFFIQSKKGCAIDKRVKMSVKFFKGNLINISMPLTFSEYNIIFCRNLLIYLDTHFQQQAIETLESLLSRHGLLFIGHAESGLFTKSNFTPTSFPKAFAYFKKSDLVGEERDGSAEQSADDSTAARKLLSDKPVDKLNEAMRLTKLGTYDEAINNCEAYLKEKGPLARTYFVLGVIFDEKLDFKNSVKMLKKAVYLNPEHLEAITLLAAIYKRHGDEENSSNYERRRLRVKERIETRSEKL